MASEERIGGSATRILILGSAMVLMIGIAAFLAVFVITRQGNLAWDDAAYLEQGLRLARLVEERGALAVVEVLREGPKPPLLAAWIEAVALVVGRERVMAVITLAAVVPFVLLSASVAAIARRRFGLPATPVAVLLLGASPLALSYGAKVMVETFMALWVLWAYDGAAQTLERPSRRNAMVLGAALGAAAMTKFTVVLLLTAPMIGFAAALARREVPRVVKARVWLWILVPALAIAAPWYAEHGESAVRFALRASQYNLLAEGRADSTPIGHRLMGLGEDLAGWPALGVVAALAVVALRSSAGRRDDSSESRKPNVAFERITLLGLGCGAAILMFPPHFDARFLLPAWPALAVCAAGWIRASIAEAPAIGKGLVYAALGVGLVSSCLSLHREPRTTTYWAAGQLIDDLVDRCGIRTLGNIGDGPDWNVCKTGFLNELRADPASCFVMYDLSRCPAEELVRRIGRLDALVVLDRNALPPVLLIGAPGLNRAYDVLDTALAGDRFERIEPRVSVDLPPLAIYVSRQEREPVEARGPSDGHRR
ncbi:glycosyltransferase family 39 protein [Tautonia sp. JC769]|uniref:ArnT family glycosyltransferase n=1 Tax=Tautonia sp. JC769 TaxID=3232135 RepID=UPI00345A8196